VISGKRIIPSVRTVSLAVLLVLFCLVRVGEAGGWAPGWVRHFGDDFLCLPLLLTLVWAAHRLAGRPASYRLPLKHSLAVLVVVTIYFEVVLPGRDPRAVGDPLDFLMYLGGLLFFHFVMNRPGREASGRVVVPHPQTN